WRTTASFLNLKAKKFGFLQIRINWANLWNMIWMKFLRIGTEHRRQKVFQMQSEIFPKIHLFIQKNIKITKNTVFWKGKWKRRLKMAKLFPQKKLPLCNKKIPNIGKRI